MLWQQCMYTVCISSESESGFIGQVSLHEQGIWLGKVALSVLTQNIQHSTVQYNTIQTNSATVQWTKEFKKSMYKAEWLYTVAVKCCATVVQRRSGECEKCRDKYINIYATV